MFEPAKFTIGAYELVQNEFQGTVRPGKELGFSDSKQIGRRMLEDCVDFSSEHHATLVAETFRIQLNLDFNTKLCFDFLEMFMNSHLDFFEQT